MAKKMYGIKRRWLLNNLSVIALILTIAVPVATGAVYYFYTSNLTNQFTTAAESSAELFQSLYTASDEDFLSGARQYAAGFSDEMKVGFEVIDRNGTVVASSISSVFTGFQPGTPDVSDALQKGKTATYLGKDALTAERVLSATAPVFDENGVRIGALRYVTALSAVYRIVLTFFLVFLIAAAGIFLFVLLSNTYFIRSIVNPVLELSLATKQIAAGEFGARIGKKYNDEIGELADAVNFMSGEIDRSITIKNDFISSVSHELRTPLTAIIGWADALLLEEGLEEDVRRGLSIIQRESIELRKLVEDLLDFSRIESGRLVVNLVRMDVKEELENTILMFEQRLAQDGMHIRYTDDCEGEAAVSGDRSRLRQVFVNIIDNARKYSPKNAAIDVTIARAGDKVAVRIADSGAGIAPEDLPYVKQRFYKGGSNKPGSGIGLAVAEEIMTLHNGVLDIESVPGEGTTVTITLPIHKR